MSGFRALLAHPESDCVFEVFSESELNEELERDPCVCEVTGDAGWELRFQQMKVEGQSG